MPLRIIVKTVNVIGYDGDGGPVGGHIADHMDFTRKILRLCFVFIKNSLRLHHWNVLLAQKRKLESAVSIGPLAIVHLVDGAAVIGHGRLGRHAALPVVVVHRPVTAPEPEPKDATLPQTEPERAGDIAVL